MIGCKFLKTGTRLPVQNILHRELSEWAGLASNKKITRISSDLRVDKGELETTGNEKYLDVNLRNRNPRNLEKMFLEAKPLGFEFDTPTRHYWNKVVFEKQSRFLVAKIVHHSGQVIVEASSSEPLIAQHLNRFVIFFVFLRFYLNFHISFQLSRTEGRPSFRSSSCSSCSRIRNSHSFFSSTTKRFNKNKSFS